MSPIKINNVFHLKTFYKYITLVFLLFLASANIVTGTPTLNIVVGKDEYRFGDLIQITVVVLENGKPVQGVAVGIEVKDPYGIPVFVEQGESDENGRYSIAIRVSMDWKPGVYTIHVAANGSYATRVFKILGMEALGVVVHVKVFDWNGLPLQGSQVLFNNTVLTLKEGDGSILLEPGIYNVTVLWGGRRVYTGFHELKEAVELELKCRVYRFTVKVLDFLGRPVSGVKVFLKSGNLVFQRTTSREGLAVFNQVPAGEYVLTVWDMERHVKVDENMEVTLMQPIPLGVAVGGILVAVVAVSFIAFLLLRRRGRVG
ncbi:MAG: hypothetical protein DRJ47_10000 [Thermoprotei archaeon]|nr:MAG: hypothetical protein DRJ47_10000 [Thermoprotei archaeon]